MRKKLMVLILGTLLLFSAVSCSSRPTADRADSRAWTWSGHDLRDLIRPDEVDEVLARFWVLHGEEKEIDWSLVTTWQILFFAIHQENLKYLPDGDIDHWQNPALTLARGGGDCEDFSILIASCVKALECPYDFWVVVGKARVNTNIGHAWCEFEHPEMGMVILENYPYHLQNSFLPRKPNSRLRYKRIRTSGASERSFLSS